MKFLDYLDRVKKMRISIGKYAILGSGPIAIRGLREWRDLDLIVTKDVYKKFRQKDEWKIKTAYGREFLENNGIELWKDIGPGEWNVNELIEEAEIIDELPFVNLKDFIKWKKQAGRDKDLKDAELAKKYLKEQVKS